MPINLSWLLKDSLCQTRLLKYLEACISNSLDGFKVFSFIFETRSFNSYQELIENSRFYFVHSYYVKVKNESNSILKSTHSLEFDSAIQNENIYGVQFHPEKSHKFGMQLLKNFTNI